MTENVSYHSGLARTEESDKPVYTQAKIRVFLAEDHNIVRNGIFSLLEKVPGIEVVGEACDGQEAVDKIKALPAIDVVLADMNMPKMTGLELVAQLKQTHPGINVLMLSMLDHENYVIQAINAGAKGYLLKKVGREELVFAVRQVANGGNYVCMELMSKIIARLSNVNNEVAPALSSDVNLSKREIEVLMLIAEGLTNSEIANKLFTSRRTVEGHRKKLLDKTGARNTAALIKFAVLHGLLK